MATIENLYTGNGSTKLFPFTFPYINESDVRVTLNGTPTTQFIFANATTIEFNTAPSSGVAIRIYRLTDNTEPPATFYPGSAIRAQDLNDNFTQNLYVTQEGTYTANKASTDAATAIQTANAATTTANSAVTTANSAVSTAQSAVNTASDAVDAANDAIATATDAAADAAASVTASTSAVNTANTANTNASAAVSTANTAAANATTALNTANTALSNSNQAISTANGAVTTANGAVTTSNSASTAATSAVASATTALNNANSAVTTANQANLKSDQALNAIANVLLYVRVLTVANIPASPANDTAVEIANSTGIENFTPLSGLPNNFKGDPGLTVRISYNATTSSWLFVQYFPNDPDSRYAVVELIDGGNFVNGSSIVNGSKILDGGSF